MYDLRNILKQEPNTIREVVLLWLTGLVVLDVVNLSDKATAIIGLIVSNTLGMFYVRVMSVSKDAIEKLTPATRRRKG